MFKTSVQMKVKEIKRTICIVFKRQYNFTYKNLCSNTCNITLNVITWISVHLKVWVFCLVLFKKSIRTMVFKTVFSNGIQINEHVDFGVVARVRVMICTCLWIVKFEMTAATSYICTCNWKWVAQNLSVGNEV